MAKRKLRSHCPVNFALEAIGDRWSLLILRDILFRGKRSYGDFLSSEEGFATNILASRLALLVKEGILRKGHRAYELTEKGLDLIPLLFEMILWSAKHDPKSQAQRIPQLVELIRKDNRRISREAMERARAGQALLPEYLR